MPIQSREPVQIPMFVETYYWGDIGQEQAPVTELEANTEPWLLTGWLGPFGYSSREGAHGAPWPSDEDCAEVAYD